MERHQLVALAHENDTPPSVEDVPRYIAAQLTTCHAATCTEADNHPKKIVLTDFGQLDGEGNVVRPSTFEDWHHDCHALATGDAHSVAVVEQSNGLKGHELRVFLAGDPVRGIDPEFVPPQPVDTEES